MKKLGIIFLAACFLILCGCAKEAPAETSAPTVSPTEETVETVPETTVETIPVPQTQTGSVLADHVPAILTTLSRGDTVDLVGEYDEENYVIKTELGYGLVEKVLLRMQDAEPYEVWTGYGKWNSKVYDNYQLRGEPVLTLKSNDPVEVLEDLGYCLLIQTEDILGFAAPESISKYRSYSGGGGGSSGGGGGGGGASGGADGGDISLQASIRLQLLSMVTQDGSITNQAEVLADGTQVVLGYLDRGDTFPIVVEDGFAEPLAGFRTGYFNGLYAYIPEALSACEGDEAYEAWDGYAKRRTPLYGSYLLWGEPLKTLNQNTQIHILCDLGDSYLVTVDELTGYMAKDMVSQTKVSTGGGYSDGGGGGGGGGGSAPEWTPPAL